MIDLCLPLRLIFDHDFPIPPDRFEDHARFLLGRGGDHIHCTGQRLGAADLVALAQPPDDRLHVLTTGI